MTDLLSLNMMIGKFIILLLIFVRISGLFIAGPFFKTQAIQPMMKIGLAVILAVTLTSAFAAEQPPVDFHLWNLVYLVFKEFFVGVAIGFSANIVFWAARFAGGLLDFDMGYQTGMLFNMDEGSPTLIGEIYDMATLMVFLIINGHHHLIQAIYASMKIVPISTFAISQSSVNIMIKLTTTVLIIGLKMAAPVLVALFVTNLALSLLARVAPQTNIFVLSLQAKIAVGLLTLMATVPLFVLLAKFSLQEVENELFKVIMSLNPMKV